ncbi:transmembrane protein 144-like isoform X2 [Alosa alosa]|uniref:transmembrane protein 144-like isoform X2 n=2 Tax=Alosa alosa TaxID=278164 RepID=UPI0020154FF7|nr:transmembrane protein 144-like isoform X2 [Alosa alosa]
MAVLGSLVQACALAFLMQMATAQVYDTSLNLNGWHRGPLVFEGSQGTESNVSEALPNSTNTHLYIKGFIALGFSTIGFGSSLVPIKRTETGNGLFFQWVFCSTMWLESLPVHFLQGSSETWLLSVVAGCLYGIGNLTNVPIIRTIGLGLGFLIWSTFCLLMGWASGRFGWFGLDPQDVASPVLNYIGTGLATVSVVIVLFMKMETRTEDEQAYDVEPLLENDTDKGHDSKLESLVDECILTESKEEAWEDKLSPLKRKIVGCSLAAFAGVLYGCCYTPIIFVKNSAIRNNTHFAGASQYALNSDRSGLHFSIHDWRLCHTGSCILCLLCNHEEQTSSSFKMCPASFFCRNLAVWKPNCMVFVLLLCWKCCNIPYWYSWTFSCVFGMECILLPRD